MTKVTAPPLPHLHSNDSYIVQLIKGDIPLVISFWVFGLIGNFGFRLLNLAIEDNYTSLVMSNVGNWLVIGSFWVNVAYSLFVLIAIWRSAGKYQGSAVWAGAARIMVIFGAIVTVSNIGSSLQLTQDTDASLIDEMNLINNGLPKQIDNDTRLDTVMVKDGNIYYNYTLVNYNVDDIDLKAFQARMAPNLIDNSCSIKETRALLDEDREIAYVYRDKESKPIHEFKMSKESCFTEEIKSNLVKIVSNGESLEEQSPITPEVLFSQYSDAVVLVRTYDSKGNMVGFGSGFNLDANGLILTNLHVILSDGEYVDVKFPKNGVYEDVFIAGFSNTDIDLVLLRVEGRELPVVEFEDTVSVEVGERVYTISNPEGMVNSLSEGLISANRNLNGVELYQMTALISQGSSGGPVFNKHGKVIGISTKVLTEGQNLNFATSLNEIENVEIFEEYFTLKQLIDALLEDNSLE